MSGRVLMIWPSLMNVGPSSSSARRIRVSRLSSASTCPLRFFSSPLANAKSMRLSQPGQAVLAQDREDLPPAVDVAVDLGDGADAHAIDPGTPRSRSAGICDAAATRLYSRALAAANQAKL